MEVDELFSDDSRIASNAQRLIRELESRARDPATDRDWVLDLDLSSDMSLSRRDLEDALNLLVSKEFAETRETSSSLLGAALRGHYSRRGRNLIHISTKGRMAFEAYERSPDYSDEDSPPPPEGPSPQSGMGSDESLVDLVELQTEILINELRERPEYLERPNDFSQIFVLVDELRVWARRIHEERVPWSGDLAEELKTTYSGIVANAAWAERPLLKWLRSYAVARVIEESVLDVTFGDFFTRLQQFIGG